MNRTKTVMNWINSDPLRGKYWMGGCPNCESNDLMGFDPFGDYGEGNEEFMFRQGGAVSAPSNPYEEFSMSMSMGPEEIFMQRRQQGVQNLMNSRTGIQPSEKMLSALDRIMGRENG